MPITLEGVTYLSVTEVAGSLGISRQTLWRWRDSERVPAGRKFRGGQVLFTPGEVQTIRDYANQVEPIGGTSPEQLKLFTRTR
jgi:predicted DNA-binding transcriptional regulator AlpA